MIGRDGRELGSARCVIELFHQPVAIGDTQHLQLFKCPQPAPGFDNIAAVPFQLPKGLFLLRDISLADRHLCFGEYEMLMQHVPSHGHGCAPLPGTR
jgi:hypothetical protein